MLWFNRSSTATAAWSSAKTAWISTALNTWTSAKTIWLNASGTWYKVFDSGGGYTFSFGNPLYVSTNGYISFDNTNTTFSIKIGRAHV